MASGFQLLFVFRLHAVSREEIRPVERFSEDQKSHNLKCIGQRTTGELMVTTPDWRIAGMPRLSRGSSSLHEESQNGVAYELYVEKLNL